MKRVIFAGASLLLFFVPASAQGQAKTDLPTGGYHSTLISDGGRFQVFDLDSRLMRKKMPFAVVLPKSYKDPKSSGRKYPVIYLLHGLFGHFENWTKKTSLVDYSISTDFIIVTPEGADGWYVDTATEKYESYIVQELIPEIDNRFRTIAKGRGRMIAGLSMGGYGAIKYGLKYPDKFSVIGSFSGALGAATFGKEIPTSIVKTIDVVFGPAGSEIRKENDVFAIVRELDSEKRKIVPYIYLSCGTEDLFFANNHDFDDLLIRKAIPHEYRELPGRHEWPFWDSQIKEFLRVAQTRLGGT